ncbi:MAG: hypothetical protein JWQ43_549, partial [Glaciihabitans sp.]|nr:hypothetical protein [Glaciihabitans sp.]
MTNLVSALCESAATATDFGVTASEIAALENSVLLAGMAAGMELAQRVETHNARYAAEIAIRSHKDLGNAGLARLEGFANTESLLQGRSGA